MKKRWIVILLVVIIGILVAILVPIIKRHLPVQFYSQWPFRHVSEERKELTKELYQRHKNVLTCVKVAEDSRSDKSIRFAFFSDEVLPEAVTDDILQTLYAHMLELQNTRQSRFPYSWEIFFCGQDAVRCAYVSRCMGTDEIVGNEEDVFSEWERVPDIDTLLTIELLEEMLHRTGIAIYHPHDRAPIADRYIHLPPDW